MENKHPLSEDQLASAAGGTAADADDPNYECFACGAVFKKSKACVMEYRTGDTVLSRLLCPKCGSKEVFREDFFMR